jgi:hypothetical protein
MIYTVIDLLATSKWQLQWKSWQRLSASTKVIIVLFFFSKSKRISKYHIFSLQHVSYWQFFAMKKKKFWQFFAKTFFFFF